MAESLHEKAIRLGVTIMPPPTAYQYWNREQWAVWSELMLEDIPPTEVPAPMDPNATLDRIRELRDIRDKYGTLTDDQADEIVTLISDLDAYLFNGGNMPRDWRPF
jgi:hypothetical protein